MVNRRMPTPAHTCRAGLSRMPTPAHTCRAGPRSCGEALRAAVVVLAGLLLLTGAPARADSNAKVTTSVDRNRIALGETLRLTVTIYGSRSARPQLPALDDFAVRSRGRSTRIQIVNGQRTTSVQHTYTLEPQRTGTLRIGPVEAVVGGRPRQSEPLQIVVRKARTQAADNAELFVETTVQPRAAYVGQQVVYTFRFFRRDRKSVV